MLRNVAYPKFTRQTSF